MFFGTSFFCCVTMGKEGLFSFQIDASLEEVSPVVLQWVREGENEKKK